MKLLIKRLLSRLPTNLPVGMTEFESFANDIIELSGAYADADSLKFAIASMIQHADAKYAALPKNYFVVRLRKVAANQIAGQVFYDIKTKQQEAQKAAETIKTVEATTSPEVVADAQTQKA